MSGEVIALIKGTKASTAGEQLAQVDQWARDNGRRVLRSVSPTVPELGDALAALRSGEAGALVVVELAVLGGVILQEAVRAQVGAAGGELVTLRTRERQVLADEYRADTLVSLLRDYEEIRSQLVAQEMRARLSKGKEATKAAGGRIGGRPQYGWRLVAGQVVRDARQQAIITRMQELWSQGLGYAPIARQLGVEGYKTADGLSEWRPGTVKRILDRERHAE